MVKFIVAGTETEVQQFLEDIQKMYLFAVVKRMEKEEGIQLFCEARKVRYSRVQIRTEDGKTIEIPCWDVSISKEEEQTLWKFQSYDIFT